MTPSSPHRVPVEPFDDYDDGFDDDLPVRTRARWLTPLTAALMALILGGVGFYVGIRVEKSKTSASTGTGAPALARAFTGARRTGAGGFASRFAGGLPGAAGGGATIGSISSVSGNTLYVTTTSGNTVKVKLSSATTITKSETVSKNKLYPGEEVVVQGSQGAKGTVTATSVTDSGAGSSTGSGSASAGATSSTGSSSAASAIKSLFGGGG